MHGQDEQKHVGQKDHGQVGEVQDGIHHINCESEIRLLIVQRLGIIVRSLRSIVRSLQSIVQSLRSIVQRL